MFSNLLQSKSESEEEPQDSSKDKIAKEKKKTGRKSSKPSKSSMEDVIATASSQLNKGLEMIGKRNIGETMAEVNKLEDEDYITAMRIYQHLKNSPNSNDKVFFRNHLEQEAFNFRNSAMLQSTGMLQQYGRPPQGMAAFYPRQQQHLQQQQQQQLFRQQPQQQQFAHYNPTPSSLNLWNQPTYLSQLSTNVTDQSTIVSSDISPAGSTSAWGADRSDVNSTDYLNL